MIQAQLIQAQLIQAQLIQAQRVAGGKLIRHDSEAAAKSGVDEIAHGRLLLARTGTSSPKARRRLDFNWLNRGQVIAADVDLIPLAGKGLPDTLLVPVDVRECAQLAVIIYPGGEVDEVDGDLTL